MSPPVVSRRWSLVVLSVYLVLSACSERPGLRLADIPKSDITVAEGKRLLEEGRAVEAVAAFRAQLRQEGVDLQGLNGLAIAYSELGRPDLAAEMFGRALALKPDDPATLNNIGFAALRRAEAKLARHYLERARRQRGDLGEIEGNLAGLALLESITETRLSRKALTRAALIAEDGEPEPAVRLSMPNSDPHAASTKSPLREGSSRQSATVLVDFTAVTDPFLDHRAAE